MLYNNSMPAEKFEPKLEAPVDKQAKGRFERQVAAEEEKNIPAAPPIAASSPSEQAAPDKDEELVMIENILSENISGIYKELSEAQKRVFRQKGEEASLKIKGLLKKARVVAHELLNIIKEWLRMLPRISHHFLEQEAKIKTDKILQMKRDGQQIER